MVSEKIKKITARQILDSRGNPTIEVDVHTRSGFGRAAIPSGASTGMHEAVELRDRDRNYHGKGVLNAVSSVNRILGVKLKGKDVTKQKELDELMIAIDGTDNKSRLGANAILGVSLAAAKCAAQINKKPLYRYLGREREMPKPASNFINGGKHAGSQIKIQEFLVIVKKSKSFNESTKMIAETYQNLKQILLKKYGKNSINIGDEGGFVPPVNRATDVFNLLNKAIEESGYKTKLGIGIDAAASEFYNIKNQTYTLDKKPLSRGELIDRYLDWIKGYSLMSIEDPFEQDDFDGFSQLKKKTKIQIVGDDLLVTNPFRIKHAIANKSVNCLLLKLNQVGTISESLKAVKLAKKAGWNVMASHRSGETNDSFLSDVAVGWGCSQIKLGAPARGERIAKFNRLLRIEEEIKK